MSSSGTFTTQGVRVAVEGCVRTCLCECLDVQPADQTKGHGTLNAIYAAVERSCEERQWDGVDVLIIGGDFQVC